MFFKGSDSRLDETIRFIAEQRPAAITREHHAQIVAALREWRRTTGPGHRSELSALLSQNGRPNRPGAKTQRKYRRATILLKCAIEAPRHEWRDLADGVHAQRAPDFAPLYGYAFDDARDRFCSSPNQARSVLDRLRDDTRAFLRENPLTIDGRSDSSARMYGLFMEQGRYRLSCYPRPAARFHVRAINIPATPYAALGNDRGRILGTRASLDRGCDFMFTTQFTGCSFCFSVNRGRMVAAHIDPEGRRTGVTGQQISAVLRAEGGFSQGNGGEFRAYGRVDGRGGEFGYPMEAQQVTILSVRRRGRWRIYSQVMIDDRPRVRRLHP